MGIKMNQKIEQDRMKNKRATAENVPARGPYFLQNGHRKKLYYILSPTIYQIYAKKEYKEDYIPSNYNALIGPPGLTESQRDERLRTQYFWR